MDWVQGLRAALDEVSGAVYPGIGGVMYVLGCVSLL